jgi:predicted metal-dependent phosphoesterase TrpH
MMKDRYIDLHTHTTRSDGHYTPEQLVDMAVKDNISVLAITDHNVLSPDIRLLESRHPGEITLLTGSEISCRHTFKNGETKEIHMVTLMYDQDDAPNLEKIALKNRGHNREEYIVAILEKLKECGIDIGTYEELCAEARGSGHVGRMHIAEKMVNRAYVSSISDAFDIYIGDFGLKKAYVQSDIEYVSLQEAVNAALLDGAVPVLAHLYYYMLSESGQEELLKTFKGYAGEFGAMETEYARYTEEQRILLRKYADRYGLARSGASDFHGFDEKETLCNHFPFEIYEEILERKRRLDVARRNS